MNQQIETIDVISALVQQLNKKVDTMSIENAIKYYLCDLKARTRKETFEESKDNLKIITDFLKEICVRSINELTNEKINLFVFYSRQRGNKTSTINMRISSLRRCLKRLVYLGLISQNPLEYFRKMKEEAPNIKTINSDDCKRIIELAFLKSKNGLFSSERNYLGLMIMFESGLRLNELFHIKIKNIFFDKQTILLDYTKTNNQRFIFLSEYLSKSLFTFIEKWNMKKSSYLMINLKTQEPFDKRAFAKWIRTISKSLGIDYSTSPHKWRHTFATASLEDGANLNYIKEILGHSSLTTTQKYLHVNQNFLKREHSKHSRFKQLFGCDIDPLI